MTRLHAHPIDVVRRDDVPAQFLWRGRLYVVCEVLAQWTESGCWWRTSAARALSDGDGPGSDAGAGSGSVDDGERDYWRVVAAAGRAAGTGVYDLCFDWTAGCWTLARALD